MNEAKGKVVLRHFESPDDIAVLTEAVRDLREGYHLEMIQNNLLSNASCLFASFAIAYPHVSP